jgi:hypothetical protein
MVTMVKVLLWSRVLPLGVIIFFLNYFPMYKKKLLKIYYNNFKDFGLDDLLEIFIDFLFRQIHFP